MEVETMLARASRNEQVLSIGLVFHCPAETTGRVLELRTSAKPENTKAFKLPQTENEGIRRTLLTTDQQELASSFSLTEKSGASQTQP